VDRIKLKVKPIVFEKPSSIRNSFEDAIYRVRKHTPEYWKMAADIAINKLIRSGKEFTTDDVWDLIDEPPPHEPRAIGAVVLRYSRSKKIVRVGFAYSRRPTAHARIIMIWKAVN
jgi:hypothetical protein